MEEPAFLRAVQGIVGGVQVEHDPLGRPPVGLQEQIDQQVGERLRVVGDLVVALGRSHRRVLQALERALAGERRAVHPLGREPLGEQRQQRIVAQLVVVAHVLVAQSDTADPLPHQGRTAVHHLVLLAPIHEAGRHPVDRTDRPIRVAQQQRAAIATHRPAVERRHHAAPSEASELELPGAPLCRHRTPRSNPVSV